MHSESGDNWQGQFGRRRRPAGVTSAARNQPGRHNRAASAAKSIPSRLPKREQSVYTASCRGHSHLCPVEGTKGHCRSPRTCLYLRRRVPGWRQVLGKNNNLADARLRRGVFWLALLSIGWLQLSEAAHQFDHAAQQSGESCQVCVQLDRADDIVANHSTATPTALVNDALVRRAPACAADATLTLGFDSRAPPQL